ncbi:MAG TPA: HEAT repeat domain-containing protein [Terriglobia bacterium]|nr:HEAT repeat domain-containing protein [Terriglobia bacterium]
MSLVLAAFLATGGALLAADNVRQEAWKVLETGLNNQSSDQRVDAVQALGLIVGNRKAEKMAETALHDDKTEVRSAAATALGQIQLRSSIPALKKALSDNDASVVTAAAHSLVSFGNDDGYEIYYEILTGERKSGAGIIDQQLKVLQNPKKLTEMGIEAGLGFVPFGGMGLSLIKILTSSDASYVRAAAAQMLVHDPDPRTAKALVKATLDKSWVVRQAAVKAIGQRDDPSLLKAVSPAMNDENEGVRDAAAAVVIRLGDKARGGRDSKSAGSPSK